MTREDHFKNIYDKANRMLAVLCAEGDISARNKQVEELTGALFEFDGGEWHTAKMFPKPVIGKKADILEDFDV